MTNPFEEQKDPDYNEFHENQSVDRSRLKEQDTKKRTVTKIESIMKDQFDREIDAKVYEIAIIGHKIRQSIAMLDRLRAYIVASYYGSGEKLVPMSKSVETKKCKRTDETLQMNNESVFMAVNNTFTDQLSTGKIINSLIKETVNISDATDEANFVVNRFYLTKKVIVGNVSKYLVVDNQKEKDKATHKWMVYVRGPPHESDISHYVKSVWFFLHPSYIPNDIVQIHKPPFQLTRRGWGEFPIRIQLHFRDSNNKRFDIIHNLKLDKTYTGLQTLGAETIVQLELRRHTEDGSLFSQPIFKSQEIQNIQPISNAHILCTHNAHEKTGKLEYIQNNNERDIETKEASIITSVQKKDAVCSRLKRLDNPSSAISSCVTSAAVSRSSSPVNLNSPRNSITDNETNLILHELITDSPLIGKHADMQLRPFSCSSLELYKQWSFSKRRASEWQRAIFIKNLFIEYIESYEKLLIIPTTKQIMIWCRRNGYTPPEINLKVVSVCENLLFCTLCGVSLLVNQENMSQLWCPKCVTKESKKEKPSSLSPFTLVLTEFKEKEDALLSLNELQSFEQNIYLCDTPINVTDCIGDSHNQVQEGTFNVTVSSTDELDWIYNTTNQVGIHLPAVTIFGMRAPIVQSMLLTAMKCFVSEMMHKSNCEAVNENKSTLQPALVTFKHVNSTIKNTVKFDFLSDAFMGICDIKTQNKNI